MRRVVLALILAVSACGGDPSGQGANAPVVDKTPPPPEVMALVVHVSGSTDEVSEAIVSHYQMSLARSGFRIAQTSSEAHDVEIQLVISKEVVPSFWRMQVNGREQVKLRVRVVAAVMGLQPSARLDMVQSEFDMTEGEAPPEGGLARLVLGYAKSPNLARWAIARQSTAPAVDPHPTAPTANRPTPADDATWYKLNPVLCKVPQKLDACDPVRAYLVKWPAGAHAAEARATLDAAQPTLEKLQKDDNDWQAVRPDDCRKKKTRDACAGVEVYLNRYPAGLHADDAKRLLGR